VIRRTNGNYGVKIAYRDGEFLGLSVWIEKEEDEAYLWLGACVKENKGIGSAIVREQIEDIKSIGKYKKISVKVGEDYESAKYCLKKFGFEICGKENGVLFLEKMLDDGTK
jgi:L-amino acid N-acyltransferase YncA